VTRALYNEIDRYPAAWIRNLAAAGQVTEGVVDERSIRQLQPDDVRGFGRVHLFAGIAGWDYALRLAGWPTGMPIWTGSCPCQPFSCAGKRGGTGDDRHLWPEMFRLVAAVRPGIVVGEQVASRDGLAWLDSVRSDLEGAGYAFRAADLCAAGVGAPHIRQRLYWVAYSRDSRLEERGRERGHDGEERATAERGGDDACGMADALHAGRAERRTVAGSGQVARCDAASPWSRCDWLPCLDGKARPVEPGTFPLDNGVPGRVGRLRAYGNAIVPQVAAAFLRAVMDEFGITPDAAFGEGGR
jgi:DNA (cytosine-5)-methyltransferase 1